MLIPALHCLCAAGSRAHRPEGNGLGPIRIAAKRLLGAIPSLAGVVVVTFLLSHALPGDPAVLFAGPAANADSVAQVRAHLGLDRSLPVQFLGRVFAPKTLSPRSVCAGVT